MSIDNCRVLWTYLLAGVTPLMVVSTRTAGDPFDFILFGQFFQRALLLNPPTSAGSVNFGNFLTGGATASGLIYFKMLASCVPSLVFAAVYLLLARRFLVKRAFTKAFNPLRWLNTTVRFQAVLEHEVAKHRGITNRNDGRNLPGDEPVAWRESQKRGLGRVSLWARVAISVLVSIFLWYMLAATQNASPRNNIAVAWCLLMWVGMLLLLITMVSSLITQERSQQTLSVLLTTPLAGADILLQKLAGIRSLLWMCLIPLGTSLVVRMLVAMPQVSRLNVGNVDYPMAFLNELTMLLIYPQEAIWLAMYFTLKSRTTIAAIMKSLFSIAFMCVFPWLILFVFIIFTSGLSEEYFWLITALLMLGPADLLLYGYDFDCIPPGADQSLFPVVLNSIIHGGLWWWLRKRCLENADQMLGRGRRQIDDVS